jgi:hypothetical protein
LVHLCFNDRYNNSSAMMSNTNMKMTFLLLFLIYGMFCLCFLSFFYVCFVNCSQLSFICLIFCLFFCSLLAFPYLSTHPSASPCSFAPPPPYPSFLVSSPSSVSFPLVPPIPSPPLTHQPTFLSSSADVLVSQLLTFACILHALSILPSSVLPL